MKLTLRLVCALASLFTLTSYTTARADDAPKAAQPADAHAQLLQGKWEGVEVGRETAGACTITISGDSISFENSKGEWYKATFKLDAGGDPKQMHAVIKDCPAPDFVGKTTLAIYKIEEGTLTLVGHPPGDTEAPKRFEGDEKSRTFSFKKAKS